MQGRNRATVLLSQAAVRDWQLPRELAEKNRKDERHMAAFFLKLLSRQQMRVLALHIGLGGKDMTPEEIAAKLRMTPGEVRTTINAALRQLQEWAQTMMLPESIH